MLGVDNSVASRTSYGGTAPAQVRAQVARWRAGAGVRRRWRCCWCWRSPACGIKGDPDPRVDLPESQITD